MENNKINEIGKKLDVDTSAIMEFKNKKKKIQYLVVNTLNYVLSCALGICFGSLENKAITGYPFLNTNYIIGLWGASSINFLNGRFTMSQRFNSILSKEKPFRKIILNIFLSITAYITIFSLIAYIDGDPTVIMYNVHNSSKKKQ